MVHNVQNITKCTFSVLRKCFTKSICGFQSFGFLHVQIVPGHIDFCVTDNILDGLNVHAQRLHLGHKGMSAAMWRQHTDALDLLQRFLELVTEMGR